MRKCPSRSEYVRNALHDLEATARDLKATIDELRARTNVPALPTVEQVVNLALDLEGRLHQDVTVGREQLRRLFKGGHLRLERRKGVYVARGQLLPLAWVPENGNATSRRREIALLSGGGICAVNNDF